MKRTILSLSFLAFTGSAWAQTPPDLVQKLSADWQAQIAVQGHVTEDVQALVQTYQALKAENEKLKADAAKPKDEAK